MSANKVTAGDLKGLQHIVIVTTDEGCRLHYFDGDDGWIRAHEEAQRIASWNRLAVVTVAARVRQIYTHESKHLLT